MRVKGYNGKAAIWNFLDLLRLNNFGGYKCAREFRCGHVLLKSDDESKPVLYVVYKRDFFESFDKIFLDFCRLFPDWKGVGESINTEALDRAVQFDGFNKGGCLLVFVHADDNVYVAYPQQVRKLCVNHNLVRKQDRLNAQVSDFGGRAKPNYESTYSFPKKFMKKFEEHFNVVIKDE